MSSLPKRLACLSWTQTSSASADDTVVPELIAALWLRLQPELLSMQHWLLLLLLTLLLVRLACIGGLELLCTSLEGISETGD